MAVLATIWLDLVCPYCFLAERALARLEAEGEVSVRVRPFEARPETPREGIALEAVLGKRGDAVFRELRWLGEEAGVAISRPERLPNSRLALEAVEMARAERGERAAADFARRAFRAYFEEGRDLGDEAILRALASELGIPRAAQDRLFFGRAFRGALDHARREAERRMIGAVPAIELCGVPLMGYQPYARLKQAVERAKR
jgi:predicted DsbA family dithiol-disulfide isomerase